MPNQPDPNTVPTSFTLPRQLLALVQKKANEQMTNKSDIIRRALMNYLTPAERKAVEAQIAGVEVPERKPAAKAKRAHASDLSWVSLDEYECSAGQPLSPDNQPLGKIRVPKCYAQPGAFILRVNGDSMDAARLSTRLGGPGGIQPGERVVMQWIEHREPQDHDIVAACLGGGCTLKRLRGAEGARWLEPESANPVHRRIDLNDESPGRIQAVMIGKL